MEETDANKHSKPVQIMIDDDGIADINSDESQKFDEIHLES